jgi:hypothetical protein
MKNSKWAGVVLLALVLLGSSEMGLAAGQPSDEFIAGYVTAMLEVQFGIRDCTVNVAEGVVTLSGKALYGKTREMALTQAQQIPGVVSVTVREPQAIPSETKGIAAATCAVPREGTFFPRGRLFDPLFGDPRWPHFSARYLYYHDNPEFDSMGAVSFGGSFPFYRGPVAFGGEWDIGIDGSVFSIFDLGSKSYDLINTDFWVAFPTLGYRLRDFSGLIRLFHKSSHLGDEYLLRDDVERQNVSYEGVDLLLSYDLPLSFRVYGGGGTLFNQSPSDLDPYYFQAGLQFESPWGFWNARVRPVGALDFKSYEETDWHADVSLRIGLQFGSPRIYPSVYQLMAEYYNGYSPNGQFYKRKIEYVGIGLHYYY